LPAENYENNEKSLIIAGSRKQRLTVMLTKTMLVHILKQTNPIHIFTISFLEMKLIISAIPTPPKQTSELLKKMEDSLFSDLCFNHPLHFSIIFTMQEK
jgi:hypothetical protein